MTYDFRTIEPTHLKSIHPSKKGILMLLNSELAIPDYLDKDLSCECGRIHSAPIHQISIGEGVIHRLPELLLDKTFQKAFLLYDTNTYKAAEASVSAQLKNNRLSFVSYVIDDPEPTPDEKTIGEILIHFDIDCDILIAVGSGTINDLCRYVSYKLRLPYIIVATAPSVDGFASNVAPLIVKHMKNTYEAHVPYAILGDTNLLCNAPLPMISAGIGDILGKYTCLCDWQIAHIITGEYHCRTIEAMVRKSITAVVKQLEPAKSREPEAIKNIMEALILSGIAMSFAGNSRPASGSEHHLSHYWEMIFLFNNKKPVLHGAKVGIGTIAVIKAYEKLITKSIDFDAARELTAQYSFDAWKTKMQNAYGPASDSVIELERKLDKNGVKNRLARLNVLEKHWDEIRSVIGQLPSSDTVYHYLSELHAPASPMAVGIDKQTFLDSFAVAKELRNRFGLLQILFDLGMSGQIAEEVWDYFCKKQESR